MTDSITLERLAERCMEERAMFMQQKSVEDAAKLWQQHILPKLGNHLINDLQRDDIAALQESLKETPYLANRILALLSQAFYLAERWGYRQNESNPCRQVRRLPEKPKVNNPPSERRKGRSSIEFNV